MNAEQFIQQQVATTMQIMNRVEKLKGHDLHTLTWRKNESSWNILECLEHLNLYGNHYLPEIEKQILKKQTDREENFKSGLLGNHFAKSMLPKEPLNKMKTFQDKNPLNARLDQQVIETFLHQQIQLLDLLKLATQASLNKVKIESSISRLIRFKLGDAFQFYINHMLRHLDQIDRILLESGKTTI